MISVQPRLFSAAPESTFSYAAAPDNDLNQRVQTGFRRVLSNPVEIITGTIFGVFFLLDVVRVALAVKEYVESRGSETGELSQDSYEKAKEVALSCASFVGTTTNTLSWADSVSLLSLGWAANPVSVIGYFAKIFFSGLEIYSFMEEFNRYSEEAEAASTPEAETIASQKQSLALLKMSSRVSFIVWAILGIVSLAVMTTAIYVTSTVFLFAVLGLMIAEMVYTAHITPKPPLPVPPPPVENVPNPA